MFFGNMIQISYEVVKEKIKEQTKLSNKEIDDKINKKIEELSDLVSRDGAAQIIANELGVKLFEVGKIKVRDILVGMRNFEIDGKVMNLSDIRNFKTEKREGRVVSFLLGDESGVIRCVLWDEKIIKEVENGNLKESNIVRIKNGYVKDNSGAEIHLGSLSKLIINPENVEIKEIGEQIFKRKEFSKRRIEQLEENEFNVSVLGTIVQVFEPRFFEICKECGSRIRIEKGDFICTEHGKTEINYVPVLNLFFDDGTDNIRVVAFRDNVKKILKVNDDEILGLRNNISKFDKIRNMVLGEQLILNGRITKNEMFERKEFVVNSVEEVNAEELLKELEEKVR